MKTRTLTGLLVGAVYIIVILLALMVNKVIFDVFVLLLMLVGAFEVSKAIKTKFGTPILPILLANIILGYLAFFLVHNFLGSQSGGVSAYFGVVTVMIIACFIYNWASKKTNMRNIFATIFVILYPITLLIYTLGLNYIGNDAAGIDYYRASILLLFLISTFSDSGAYLIGSTFKGPKLCPSISPNKTVSGAVGGILGGILASSIVLCFSTFGILSVPMLSTRTIYNIVHFLIIGAVGSVFVQIGDLIASYFKRQCGVKDFGTILPGHGGIMDRIDGMMMLSVFLFAYLSILVY